MTAVLLQKILASLVILTSAYLTFIFAVHYDLTRRLSSSIFQLLPGIIFFGFGLAISILFNHPDLIFKQILPIKSGFAKSIIGSTILPLIGTSIRTLSIIASLSALIDKMWFYWLKRRLYFIIRISAIIVMAIIAGNTLFKVIFVNDQASIARGVIKLNKIGAWSGSALGIILSLLTILAIPQIFAKKKDAT